MTNDHKLNTLSNTYLLSQSFPGSEVWAWLPRILCSGSHRAGIRVSVGYISFWISGPSSKLTGLWAAFGYE